MPVERGGEEAEGRPDDHSEASAVDLEQGRLLRPAKRLRVVCARGRSHELTVPVTVYPPREDSHLLDRIVTGLGAGAGRRLLEVGCGSGFVSVAAAADGWEVGACDIHPWAVAATRAAAAAAGVTVRCAEGGPGDTPADQWAGEASWDVIAWNLPYLDAPEGPGLRLGPLEEASLSDPTGSAADAADRLLAVLAAEPQRLRPGGVVLLLHGSTSAWAGLPRRWRAAGWATRPVGHTWLGSERLRVLACWRPWGGRPLDVIDRTDSTNGQLLREGGPAGRALVAREQDAGRGRRGATWLHAEGGLAMSWFLHDGPAAHLPADWGSIEQLAGHLQLAAAVACVDASRALAGLAPPSHDRAALSAALADGLSIRWPNDVLVHGGKAAGTLLEGRSNGQDQRLVLGIGANLRHPPDPAALPEGDPPEGDRAPMTALSTGAPQADAISTKGPTIETAATAFDVAIASLLEPLSPGLEPALDLPRLAFQLAAPPLATGRHVITEPGPARATRIDADGSLRLTSDARTAAHRDLERMHWSA